MLGRPEVGFVHYDHAHAGFGEGGCCYGAAAAAADYDYVCGEGFGFFGLLLLLERGWRELEEFERETEGWGCAWRGDFWVVEDAA